jgi:O-antigen/teichoic acid export membrane protein
VKGLRQLVVRGVFWRSAVSVGDHILRILFTIVLARLLTKADFGIVAMALLFTRFMQTLFLVPFGGSIVRDQEVTDAQITAILLYQIGVSLVVSAGCCAAAPLAAAFFGEPGVAPVVAALAWTVFVTSLSFPTVLLRRRMEFAGYSALELGSMLFGNTLALIAAFSGLGLWSLVIRLLADRLVFAAGVWWIARWRPVRPSFRGVGRHIRFGLHMLGANILGYASVNLAAILVGKFAGAELLGCFMIAFNLAIVPAGQVQAVLTTALMPAFAILQADVKVLARKAYVSMFSLGVVYIPVMIGLAAVAKPFVVVAYGPKWADAGGFLSVLAGVGLIKGLEHLLRAVIVATGRSGAILRITAIEAASSALFLALGARFYGIVGIVAGQLAAAFVSIFFSLRAARAAVGGEDIFMRAIRRSLAVAALMAVAVAAVSRFATWPNSVILAVQVLLGALLYFALRVRALSDDERTLVRSWPIAGPALARR